MDVSNDSTPDDRSARQVASGERGETAPSLNHAGRLATYFSQLDESVTAQSPDATRVVEYESRLAQVRLGVAAGLFTALRAKHAPTASHSLRVAMGVSCWAIARKLPEEEVDPIEVAALLHDIGKIGVPDRVLLKPGKLSHDERLTIDQHRQIGVQILLSCCASQEILDIVKYAAAWYNGDKTGFDRSGEDLPLGARMVSVVDAYDAMTTDHVYRRAMSRERAIAELYRYAGRQFDPQLVEEFAELIAHQQINLHRLLTRRWLEELRPETVDRYWRLGAGLAAAAEEAAPDLLFYQTLLDNIHDAVVYIDRDQRVRLWNRTAERLTGIAASCIVQRQWSPSVMQLRDEANNPLDEQTCPVSEAMRTGIQVLRRLTLINRAGGTSSVDAHVIPVTSNEGTVHGVSLLLHDTSQQVTLEKRLAALQHRVTRDPLTQVANRAEFDRAHARFIEDHTRRRLPCSLIICDLDHFKSINDTFGHQAGDEALVSFATLLRRQCRPGDLVARYGGEEFVILCVDCDIATATRRAEDLRRELESIEQPALQGRRLTASFGVTQLQPGDSPETMLRRADRALLQAKESGRNCVVELGDTAHPDSERAESRLGGWLDWFRSRKTPEELLRRTLVTAVPLKVAAEKLKGFIADHHAQILVFEENHVVLQLPANALPLMRRKNDRPVALIVGLTFEEERSGGASRAAAGNKTYVEVVIRPRRSRERRRRDGRIRARQVLLSLKSYLMASHIHSSVD